MLIKPLDFISSCPRFWTLTSKQKNHCHFDRNSDNLLELNQGMPQFKNYFEFVTFFPLDKI